MWPFAPERNYWATLERQITTCETSHHSLVTSEQGRESIHLPVTDNTYTSVPKPGSKPEACVPGRDVLRLWSILVLGNHCGLTILGSQNRILRSSEQEDIGKLEAWQWVSAMLSVWLRHLLTLISTWWPCLIHQRGRREEDADVHDWPSYWDIFLNVIWCNKCGHKLTNFRFCVLERT